MHYETQDDSVSRGWLALSIELKFQGLGSRQRELLNRIVEQPGRSKIDVITNNGKSGLSSASRAYQYQVIDKLITLKLVENRGTGSTYKLYPSSFLARLLQIKDL